jgi:hypothetical protein
VSANSSIEWCDALVARFWRYVDVRTPSECWPWKAGRFTNGYGQFRAGKRKVKAHRVALELTNGRALRDGQLACHRCDNPPCCNPAHLFAGSSLDNARDRDSKGRTGRHGKPQPGESNPAAKLNLDAVLEIRRIASTGVAQCRIAAAFGMSASQIGNIVRGTSWKEAAWLTEAR